MLREAVKGTALTVLAIYMIWQPYWTRLLFDVAGVLFLAFFPLLILFVIWALEEL